MPSFNKVFLIGNLTKDPELRYIPSGAAVLNFRLAVNRFYNDTNGEKKQDTCYINVVAWRKLAETCGEYLNKGHCVFVEGRLQSRNWETEDGQKRSVIEVIADRIQFLDRNIFSKTDEDSTSSIENLETLPEEEKEIEE